MSDAASIARLLAATLGRPVEPGDVDIGKPAGGGWSNDTVLVDLPNHTRVVVRRTPERVAMFPTYDLAREHACLQTLQGAVPVPKVLGEDLAGQITGRPAFVMDFVEGRIPSDDKPTFVQAGWLHDADPLEQAEFHTALLQCIAAINAVVPPPDVVHALRRSGPTACVGLIDDLRRIWDFDPGEDRAPIVDEMFHAVYAAPPADPKLDVMLWGDARPANVICQRDGFQVAALLDFELAAWGPAELDVTWLAEMNRMRTIGSGLPPLSGFLDDTDAAATYERSSRRALDPDVMAWATKFNALKVSVMMHRHLRVTVHEGRLPSDHRVLVDNVSTRRCAELLDT
jgi:aminoglycoside phosphotransferase (APT) family kinase protein